MSEGKIRVVVTVDPLNWGITRERADGSIAPAESLTRSEGRQILEGLIRLTGDPLIQAHGPGKRGN